MKKLVSFIALMVLTLHVGSAAIMSGNDGEIQVKWTKTTIDLGEIEKNKPAPATFVFSNTGELPVIISTVKASCVRKVFPGTRIGSMSESLFQLPVPHTRS